MKNGLRTDFDNCQDCMEGYCYPHWVINNEPDMVGQDPNLIKKEWEKRQIPEPKLKLKRIKK